MKKFALALLALVLVLGLCAVASAACNTAETENHDAVTMVSYKPATCKSNAVNAAYCTTCSKYVKKGANDNWVAVANSDAAFHREVPESKLPTHNFALSEAPDQKYEATCELSGSYVWYCKDCKEATYEETIPSVKHTWHKHYGDVRKNNEYIEATCTANGYNLFDCDWCGAKGLKDINEADPATQHNYVFDAARSEDATCYEAGNKYEKCSKCGDIKNTAIPAWNHKKADGTTNMVKTVMKAATCWEAGEAHWECAYGFCTYNYDEPIPQLTHKYGPYHIDVAATCEKDGIKSAVCVNVGCKNPATGMADVDIQVIESEGHKYVWTVLAAAKCEVEGTELGTCSVCGDNTTRPIAALEHKFGEYSVIKEATATVCGIKARTCELCKFVEYQTYGLNVTPETPADPDAPAVDEDEDNNNSEGSGSTTGSGSDASIPATGDNTSNVPYIMMVAAVAGLVVLVASKRKVNC